MAPVTMKVKVATPLMKPPSTTFSAFMACISQFGNGAYLGSGSVITKDVPADALTDGFLQYL